MRRTLVTALVTALVGTTSLSLAEQTAPKTLPAPLAAPLPAAQKRTYPYNPFANFDWLAADLKLSKLQQEQIYPILEELEKELLPFKKLGIDKQGARGHKFVEKRYAQIRERLEPEQLTRFNDLSKKGLITSYTR